MLKSIGWVVLAGVLASLPGALYLNGQSGAPTWYIAIVSLSSALGIGIFAMAFGVIVLLAARSQSKGGLKIAVLSTAVLGLLSSAGITLR